jgi:serine protease
LPVRVLAKCGGYDSDIIAGMRWAAGLGSETVKPSQNARVLNLSLGGEGSCSKAYQDVLAELSALKVVVVASAGNTVGKAVSVPANCPGVIAVAGIRHVGTKVGYSALGPEVTLSAPSGNCGGNGGACSYPILTTLNSGTTTADATSNGQTYSGSGSTDASYGTSFSAPQVSGTVALMLSVRPELTTAAVKQILKNTARAFPTAGGSANIAQCQAPTSTEQDECYCTTTTCGAGMLDAGMAVAAASLPVALVTVNPSSPVSGQSMSLSGATSLPGVGGTAIVSYSWTLVDGGGIVSALLAGNDPAVVSATPGAAGSFTVQLTVNDGVNPASSSLHTVTVTVPSVTTTQAQSGGGGGGALSELTLAALLGFVLLARRFQVRRKRAIAR